MKKYMLILIAIFITHSNFIQSSGYYLDPSYDDLLAMYNNLAQSAQALQMEYQNLVGQYQALQMQYQNLVGQYQALQNQQLRPTYEIRLNQRPIETAEWLAEMRRKLAEFNHRRRTENIPAEHFGVDANRTYEGPGL